MCLHVFCLWLLTFPWYPIWQDLWPDNLTEINIPSSMSVTDQVCVSLLPLLPFVSQVCVSLCSCFWLPPLLVLPFCIEKVLDWIPLKDQTLPFHMPLQKYFFKNISKQNIVIVVWSPVEPQRLMCWDSCHSRYPSRIWKRRGTLKWKMVLLIGSYLWDWKNFRYAHGR